MYLLHISILFTHVLNVVTVVSPLSLTVLVLYMYRNLWVLFSSGVLCPVSGHHSPSDAAQYPRRTQNSASQLWKPKNSNFNFCLLEGTLHIYIYTGLFKMVVGVLKTCRTQYAWDRSICIFFYLIEQHSKFLLHTLQVKTAGA